MLKLRLLICISGIIIFLFLSLSGVQATTYTCSSSVDSATTAGALRSCIIEANKAAGPHTIVFKNLAFAININDALGNLPALAQIITIDATSSKSVVINRGSTATGKYVFKISSSSCKITGGDEELVLQNAEYGVWISGAYTGNVISYCRIGTDLTGASAVGNVYGVCIDSGAYSNTIGGATDADRNLISGNTDTGVWITGTNTTNNIVTGNYIGTNLAGTAALANSVYGVRIDVGATTNTIGGTKNVISGQNNGGTDYGIYIAANSNKVTHNYVGLDAAGTGAIANYYGVYIAAGAQSNTIGNAAAGSRNYISGNAQDGVVITGVNASSNVVIGNYIGTATDGTTAVANGGSGVYILTSASLNTIGSLDVLADSKNIISGNTGYGVRINGATNNVVIGNYIGIKSDNSGALANSSGVYIENAATTNTIGGTTDPLARNIISGNTNYGVWLTGSGTSSNIVRGNYIGVNLSDTAVLANGTYGVYINGGASANTIGGISTDAVNVISGQSSVNNAGIYITGSNNNIVRRSYIGVTADGTAARANYYGVYIAAGAQANTIGSVGGGNVISGNDQQGIYITAAGIENTINNVIIGNYIGLNSAGGGAIANTVGIYIVSTGGNAQSNTIGGVDSTYRNVISGNSNYGIWLSGSNAKNNVIKGNYIGLDKDGVAVAGIANGFYGIRITDGAQANTIGGISTDIVNVISGHNDAGNADAGIYITGSGTSNNIVKRSYIGTNYDGTVDLGNDFGVFITGGASSNTIGSVTSGERNVISGNDVSAVCIDGTGGGATYNQVIGNYVGTQLNGTTALPNTDIAIDIVDGAQSNTIGGANSTYRNVIAGNTDTGIGIAGTAASNSSNNLIKYNYIGLDSAAAALGNGNMGISIEEYANSNTIDNNTIGNNGGVGISIDDTVSAGLSNYNKITQNSTYDNTGLGIDLVNTANESIAAPSITTVTDLGGGNYTIAGTTTAVPDTSTVEVFIADVQAAGPGEGETYKANGSVTSNAFSINIAGASGTDYVTATVTNTTNSTSEFSGNVTLAGLGVILKNNAGDDYDTWAIGTVDASEVRIMTNTEYVLVKNDGGANEDFSITGANATNWTLSGDGNVGPDIFVLMGLFNGANAPVAGDYTWDNDKIITSERWADGTFYAGAETGTNVVPGTGHKLYIYFKAPSTNNQTGEQNDIVTIGCRKT